MLSPEAQSFIAEHENSDVQQLILKHRSLFGYPVTVIADQIVGRRKAKDKLPTFYKNARVFYPPALNIEQSSSEQTARFKGDLIQTLTLSSVGADLTGGFGVDTFFLSQRFKTFHHIEPNQKLSEIAQHNHHLLGAVNISYHQTTAEQFLDSTTERFGLLFIDPSRRTASDKKVFLFSDCEPNVPVLLERLFSKAENILIKASPLIDIQQGIAELANVTKVIVLAVSNECKEVLFLLSHNASTEPEIDAINIQADHIQRFGFTFSEERETIAGFSEPLTYLYEPNAAILKAGAFKSIARSFGISKLHSNTHLYTSPQLMSDFSGKVFRILEIIKPDAKVIRQVLPERKANVVTRNYPLSAVALKSKLGLKDGGDKFIIGFTGQQKKYVVLAERAL